MLLDWQKDILGKAGLPADLNSIIGRQVRCDFAPAYDGDTKTQETYVIAGISFATSIFGHDDSPHIQFVVEAVSQPDNIERSDGLARPFLSYDRAWQWEFYDTRSHQDTDRDNFTEYTGWHQPRVLKTVTWL